MKKYKCNINNLDCANCARKLEEELNKNSKLNNVIVNFTTSKVTYESDELTIKDVNKLIKNIEPDSYLTETEEKNKKDYTIIFLSLGVMLGLISLYIDIKPIINKVLLIISYMLLLYKPFMNSIKTLIKSRIINENLLIVVSVIGAYIVGEELEGIMVVALYLFGKILEEKAVNNSRKSIKNLMDIKEDYANKKIGNEFKKVKVEEVNIKDRILVKKGERIPLDGKIIKGKSYLNMSALTGESELVKVKENDNVLSGSINEDELLEIEVTARFEDSSVSRILDLIEEASSKKAKTETLVSRLSKYYTPIILILAVLVGITLPILTNLSIEESAYRALTFLVISCPCAIAISVPLSYFTGIGVSSKKGILVKGSNYLDNLSKIEKIIFDKTGTLTTGVFEVEEIIIEDKKYKLEEINEIVSMGESLSNHPIANALKTLSNKKINTDKIKDFKELSGSGISFKLDNKTVLIGTSSLCNCSKKDGIHVNIDGKHTATIIIRDKVKEDAPLLIKKLKRLGIKPYMFTGDKERVAKNVASLVGIDEYHSEMLPEDKYKKYEEVSSSHLTAFVGDGINDTPVLRRSDIGISMGTIGSKVAIEASDVVIMKDDLNKINEGIEISKYTRKIIIENLVFALFIKALILILSVVGLTKMWAAVFADTGLTLLTILNTLRIINKFKN